MLIVFHPQSLSLHIIGINDFTSATKGLQTQFVECTCEEQDRETLYDKLREGGATDVKKFNIEGI